MQDGTIENLTSKWETGKAIPSSTKLPKLSKVLGVSLDWLMGIEERPEPTYLDTFTEEEAGIIAQVRAGKVESAFRAILEMCK